MPIALKQSTASQEVMLGYFVDSTDGNTEETGLTINNTDILVWKNGATTLPAKTAGGATHVSNGLYYTVLDATDTNTLGPLVLFIHVAGALAVRVECEVYPANVYDSLYSTDLLQVDVREKGSAALDLTATEKASVNTEVDTALNTAVPGAPTANSINDRVVKTHQVSHNKWEMTGNQLIIYADDGLTALYTFDLVDAAGAPAMEKVYKRTPV